MEFEKKTSAKLSPTRLRADLQLGKIPPQAIELEEAVLGALMLEKDALTEVIDILKTNSFYDPRNQRIYGAILTLFTNSQPVDLLTVTNQLRTTGELELSGGPFYITQLTTKVNSASNIEYHARVLVEMTIKRELISISGIIQRDAYEDTTDVFELLDKTEQSLFEVAESSTRKSYEKMSDVMRKAITELEDKKDNEDGLTGIPSGFTKLDRVTSGWQRSDLVIIAARPAMGKTAFILSAVRNAAVDFGHACAVFSLEMSAVQLVNRLISAEAELDSKKIRSGNMAEHEWAQLHQRIGKLTAAPIFIDDTPALSILELRAKCRRLKAQHNIQMIVIDYLQLMSGDTSSRKSGNREQEIASISRSLKNLAKELDVPVIALAQLSRAVETRGGDKKPMLSDLRESGSIEQDADMVMFLYRPEYYSIEQYPDGTPTEGIGEVLIAKNRHGDLEDVQLRFIGRYTKFADYNPGFGLDNNPDYNPTRFPISGGMDSGDGTVTLGSKANSLPPLNMSGDDDDVPF